MTCPNCCPCCQKADHFERECARLTAELAELRGHYDNALKEACDINEKLAAAKADLQTALDVINNNKYLSDIIEHLKEPIRKERDALSAELKLVKAEVAGHKETWAEMKKWKPFLHWCHDWDGLLVDQDDVEFESCSCFENKPPRDSFRTVLEDRDRLAADAAAWREMAGKLAEEMRFAKKYYESCGDEAEPEFQLVRSFNKALAAYEKMEGDK